MKTSNTFWIFALVISFNSDIILATTTSSTSIKTEKENPGVDSRFFDFSNLFGNLFPKMNQPQYGTQNQNYQPGSNGFNLPNQDPNHQGQHNSQDFGNNKNIPSQDINQQYFNPSINNGYNNLQQPPQNQGYENEQRGTIQSQYPSQGFDNSQGINQQYFNPSGNNGYNNLQQLPQHQGFENNQKGTAQSQNPSQGFDNSQGINQQYFNPSGNNGYNNLQQLPHHQGLGNSQKGVGFDGSQIQYPSDQTKGYQNNIKWPGNQQGQGFPKVQTTNPILNNPQGLQNPNPEFALDQINFPGQQNNQRQIQDQMFYPADRSQNTQERNGKENKQDINNNNQSGEKVMRPPSAQSTSRTTTSNVTPPATSTAECERNCPVTEQYDPMCGTNNVTYGNGGKLMCAKQCGVDVRMQRRGRCTNDSPYPRGL